MGVLKSVGNTLTPSPVTATKWPFRANDDADRKLLGGIDAGMVARIAGERVERRRAARFRLADGIAGNDLIVSEGEACRGRDRPRGSRIVSGDHRDLEAGRGAGPNRLRNLRP